jgi:hypothetical protein
MDELELFDCSCEFGPYRTRVYRAARTAPELIDDMDFVGIERALVWHTASRFDAAGVGNCRLLDEIQDEDENRYERLEPSWTLLPSHTRELPTLPEMLVQMKENQVRSLRLFQNEHRYFLDEMTWGDQMAELETRKIPLFIKAPLDEIATLLKSFPDLTVVTGTQGFNPMDRYAWPLIERYPNLHYETSSYLADAILEEFCGHWSASRLVFGSGYPGNAYGAALFRLVRAELEDDQRRLIAAGNLDRLLGEADFS